MVDDEWDQFLETLERARRHDAEHNAEVKAGDFVGLPEDLPVSKHPETADVKYERGAYYCVEFRVQLMDNGRKANDELIRVYANNLSSKMVGVLNNYHKTGTTFKLDESNQSMAIFKACKWEQWAMNHFSAGGDITVEQFKCALSCDRSLG